MSPPGDPWLLPLPARLQEAMAADPLVWHQDPAPLPGMTWQGSSPTLSTSGRCTQGPAACSHLGTVERSRYATPPSAGTALSSLPAQWTRIPTGQLQSHLLWEPFPSGTFSKPPGPYM